MPAALFRSIVFDWFRAKYGSPTPAQKAAWPLIRAGKNVLIASPTGTGKTFAAFLAVLDALVADHARGELPNSIQCLYVSPLRALGYDLEKNLANPLSEIFGERPPIRVELRTGDTTSSQRQRQFTKPPHILLTTPESLCVMLSQEKWLPLLATIRWLIVDEIHALADNKRGAHLSLSIERLAQLRETNLTRPDLRGAHSSRVLVASSRRNELSEPPDLAEDTRPGDTTASKVRRVGTTRPALGTSALPGTSPLQRIGLSATIAPLSEVARFLTGTHGECEIVDVSTKKRIEISVHTPLRKNPYPEAGYTGQRLIRELGELIKKHKTTLIFSNVRSGAEGVTYWLREQLPELADQIECHHGSLERDVRREVEDRLKRGELRAVVCSTSLELGIDIGSIELVVMMSTPKGVSKALQRAGRAGHNIHSISRGILMATNVSDLVEACATVLLARTRHLEEVRIPHVPLDVLAQHLVSMGCTREWPRDQALELVRQACPFAELAQEEFDDVLDYLAGGGRSLRQQYTEVFGKIELDDEVFRTREGRVRRDFLQNIGVIPNVGSVRVRAKMRVLGTVEEMFIRAIRLGDVFMMSGRPVRLDKVTQMEAWVTPAPGAIPTVPRWNAAKMALSNRVAQEIVAFRSELRLRFNALDFPRLELPADAPPTTFTTNGATRNRSGARWARPTNLSEDSQRVSAAIADAFSHPSAETMRRWIATRLDCGAANAGILWRMHVAQHLLSEIPTADFLLVEELRESDAQSDKRAAETAVHYFFHSLIGRAANDALARVVTFRLSQLRGGNAIATPHDYGFVLTVAASQRFTEAELPELLRLSAFESELHASLAQSEMLKYHFRNAAQTGLMVYRNHFDQQKPMRKLAWSSEVIFNVLQQHEPDHVLMREARRDTLRNFLDAEGALTFLHEQSRRPLRLRRVDRVPPLSFAMYATKIKEALLVEDPYETMERLYHKWWGEIETGA